MVCKRANISIFFCVIILFPIRKKSKTKGIGNNLVYFNHAKAITKNNNGWHFRLFIEGVNNFLHITTTV